MTSPLFAFSLIFSAILLFLASLQHFLLGTQVSDIGTFEQFSWLIANGKFNVSSSFRGITPLQDHFSLLLIPIGLIYKALPSTYTLLALQSFSLGILPAIAANETAKSNNNRKLLLALIIAITLSPYIFLVNLGDFHPEILTAPLMLLAISETSKRRNWLYYTSLLISLSAKKAQVLFGVGLAIYSLAKGQSKRAITTLTISSIWWIVSSNYSAIGGDYIKLRLGYLGNNIQEIVFTLVTRPWQIFTEASPESILLYTLGLILPFLALISKRSIPAILATFPVYFTNIISSEGIQRELNHHYSIIIVPFLIAGCIETINSWKDISRSVSNRIYYITIITSLLAFIGYSRIGYFSTRYFPLYSEAIAFQEAKQGISSKNSVLTNKTYAAHLANREILKIIETGDYSPVERFDYILLPQSTNLESKGGKLVPIKGSETEKVIETVIQEAREGGLKCSSYNKFIRLCTKSP
ncbi:DUF2079 domain-containing protein [Prochlorococcus sp. MIT 1341]|uniref:DUF2079 domain-containing protein n=1 Tax=Prochlorococcus sp. MIT 1341 TaxID=3096221 RepID=UPI002A756433|nr:DUF2079 domain-containing protein [Prochlorococcus sp. MIT 1341]